MYCPSCGKSIADGSAFCMYCGKPTGFTDQPTPVPTNTVAQPNSPVCPNCHQMDAVKRTAGVMAESVVGERSVTQTYGHSRGASVALGSGGSVGALGGSDFSSVSYTEGVAMTALAARLAELRSRQSSTPYVLPSMPPEPPSNSEPYTYWDVELRFRCTLLTGVFGTRWRNLYYCSRCAGVFVLGENEFAPLDNLEQFLYRYPAVIDHDFCELQDVQFGFTKVGLIAMAYGAKGVYVVQEQRWKGWYALGRGGGGLRDQDHRDRPVLHIDPDYSQNKANYDKMLSYLQAAGWVKLNEQGEHWFNARFVLPHTRQIRNTIQVPRRIIK